MIIKPKIRAFICVTAHPEGCAAHVREQIAHIRGIGRIAGGPRNVLIIGASAGYGLATRIVSAFGAGSSTVGVFFERPAQGEKTATAGWYNTAAFEAESAAAGIPAWSVNGDAFSASVKDQVEQILRAKTGPADLVVYSLAAPRRTDPVTGQVWKSALKPIGAPYSNKYLDTDKRSVEIGTLDPATEEDIDGTIKVMGGEDWALWIDQLSAAGLLAPGARTIAYDYIGPEVTWPIYHQGTIGRAKQHLRDTADRLHQRLAATGGGAWVSVNKGVVTQASSAIPGVNLYLTLMFKVMKEKGLHEGCIEQIDRLFRQRLCTGGPVPVDSSRLIRVDDWEMRPDVQSAISAVWPLVSTETLSRYADFEGYRDEFLKLFGFGLPGVDYEADVSPDRPIPSLAP